MSMDDGASTEKLYPLGLEALQLLLRELGVFLYNQNLPHKVKTIFSFPLSLYLLVH